uniref:Neur_chan_LBD domain-containing protein n=1 Tax=Parastrongyloides trichosuri TaxID=131310 RepID=A0A0N5A4V5_PARTI
MLLFLPFTNGRRLRNNGKARSLNGNDQTITTVIPQSFVEVDKNTINENSSNNEDELFTEPPWTDKQIVEEILKRYRFPESSSNISVAVFITVDKILPSPPDVCSMQIKIKQKWMENRLSYRNFRDSIHPIKFRSLNYIWSPSLNIDNAISMVGLGKEDIKVYSNGMLEYEQRYQIIVDTYSLLNNYPFDVKNCSIHFSNEDTRASWSYLSNADVGASNKMMAGWQAISWSRGHHSLLITLKRNVQNLMFSYFLPTMLLSIVGVMPLFFSPLSKFNRVVFGGIIFLTTFLLTLFHFQEIPKTSYLKAIEIWALFTNIFTFASLTESIFITNCAFQRTIRPPSLKASRSNYYEDNNDERARWINETPYYAQLSENKPRSIVTLLDCLLRFILVISLISFIMYFLLRFCIPYWDCK